MASVNPSISRRSYGPVWREDVHAFAQIVLPHDGVLLFDVAGSAGSVDRQHMAVLPAGAAHAFRAIGPNAFTIIDLPEQAHLPVSGHHHRGTFVHMDERLQAFARFVSLEAAAGVTSEPLVAAALSEYLLRWLGRLPDPLEAAAIGGGTSRYLADRIRAVIDQRWNEPRTVAEIAHAVSVSPAYAARVFRAIHGTSIVTYLNRTRIERARALLCLDRSISDVATACGFGSPAYFSRTFRQHTGQTPRQFRQNCRNLGSVC